MKVDFFILGSPRCGTSALAKYLAEHPSCGFSIPKEPWFFCNDLDTGYGDTPETVEEYHEKCFGHLEPDQCFVVGEGSPVYLASDVAVDNILKYNPEARFIVMLRNPFDMIRSIHRGLVHHGERHENIVDLREAWKAQKRRRGGEDLPPDVHKPVLLQYKRIGSQGSQMRRLVGRAGADKVHAIFFEDLNESFNTEYQKALEFLGLPRRKVEKVDRVLPTVTWKSGVLGSVYRLFEQVARKLPFKPKLGILRGIKKRLSRPVAEEAVDQDLRREILEEFVPEIEILEVLTGRDLSHWKP